jgi:hypothetical protein
MADKKQEVLDFKLKAYRTLSEGDHRYQNWQQSSTVELLLVVEIDGVEIPVAQDVLPYATWEHMLKNAPNSERSSAKLPSDQG